MESQTRNQTINKLQHEIVAIRPKAFKDLLILEGDARKEPQIQSGVVTIPIYGPLRQRNEIFGTDYSWIHEQLLKAFSNPSITRINLEIDSPGGEVLGISELAEFVYASRKIKPIIAIVKNMACSAAYWLASACNQIILAGETTITGSIGVLAMHVDQSSNDQKNGIKITEVASGKYKNIVSPNAPLSADGQAYLKDQVDHLYSTFVKSIAKYRSMDVAKVVAVADGREYIGSQAIGLGLADGIQTTIKGVSSMNPEEMQKLIDELKKENEQLKQQLEQSKPNQDEQAKAAAESVPEEEKQAECAPEEEKMKQAIASATQKAMLEERNRLIALDEIDRGGASHDIVMQAKRDGFSAEKAALMILRAQSRVNKNIRDDFRAESQTIATSPVSPTDEEMKQTLNAIVGGAKQYVRRP